MDLASLFAGTAAAVRIIFLSHALPEPARKLAKTLDQGLRAVERLQPEAHVLQPCQIGFIGLIAQCQFGILLLPK
jgi:hypothetical protein